MTLSSWASRPSSFVPLLDTLRLANSLSLFSSAEFTFAFESRIPEPTPFLSKGPLRILLNLAPCRPVSSTAPGLKQFDKSATRRTARDGRLGLPSPVAATRSMTSVACPTVATRLSKSPCATSARKNGHGLLGDTVRSALASMWELQFGNDRLVRGFLRCRALRGSFRFPRGPSGRATLDRRGRRSWPGPAARTRPPHRPQAQVS